VAYVILLVATAVINTVNVLSYLDEREWQHRPIDWWQPAVWEGSSGLVFMAIAWICALTIRRFPLAGPRSVRNLGIHAAVTVPFSLVHVGAMVALRHGAYAIAGETYDFPDGWNPLLYEYRKDVITYALFTGIFWLTARLMHGGAPASMPAPDQPILIDEGQRVIRAMPRELLCARSSGNYVEFHLADGRRPLMRTTLAAMEAQLTDLGFVRTHRSWLVNPAFVTEIEAEGSGDYGLTLTDGTKVPVSRRYPAAVGMLRR
jgi:DNA-binding LytR/AlgR family response regulator